MTPRYKLYYWPIPFRGHFIRYTLAMAGQDWEEATFDEVAAIKNGDPTEGDYPKFAPPVLVDRESNSTLSQMPAIVMALGRDYGLIGDADLALRLICDASDVLFETSRYHGALMWDAEAWAEFSASRLPRWMVVHEEIAKSLAADGPKLEHVILTALWHTMVDKLPPLRPVLQDNAPTLDTLVDNTAAIPAIAAVIADWADRSPIYCGGQIEASLLNVLNMET